LQYVRDMSRDRTPGQEKLRRDLGVGQSGLNELSDLGLGWREALPSGPHLPVLRVRSAPDAVCPEPGLNPRNVGGRAESGRDLHGLDERDSGLRPITVIDKALGCRLERLCPE